MPMTGAVDGAGNSAGLLARINFLREEPGGSGKRFFVNDLNGPLYILDKDTKKLTTYLNFNGLEGQPGMFHRLAIDNLLARASSAFNSIRTTRAMGSSIRSTSKTPRYLLPIFPITR